MGEAEERAKKAKSEYIGKVGEKLKGITLTIERKINFGSFSYNGPDTILYIMRDAAGNVVTWRSATDFKKDIGDTFVADATIKAHELYTHSHGSIKQTKVLRLKLV